MSERLKKSKHVFQKVEQSLYNCQTKEPVKLTKGMKTYEKLLLRRVFAKLSVESELRLDTSRLPMASSLMTFWCIIPPSLTVPQSILTIFLRSIRFPLWSRTEPVSLSLLSSVGFFHWIFVRHSYNCENCKIRLVNHKRILLNLPPTGTVLVMSLE